MKSNSSRLLPILYLTLGWFGIQMAMALDATQFQVMLDSKLHSALFVGAILGIGPLAGITVQPIIGWYGDQWQREGLSRQKLIQYSLVVALLSTLVLSQPMSLAFLISIITVFYFSFNVLMVSYRALVTETSGRKALNSHKGVVSGFVALFSGAGSFAMFALCSVVGDTPYPFWIGGLLLLVTFLLFFRFAPEAKTSQTSAIKPTETVNLFQKWNLVFYAIPVLGLFNPVEEKVCQASYQRQIFRLFVVLFFSWIGIQALRGYFVLYVMKALHLSFSIGNILLAILTLVMVAAALPLGKLADKFDNRLLYRAALLFFAVVCFLAFPLVRSFSTAVVMSILLGVSFAGMIVFPLSILFKLCPSQNEGSYAGLYNLFLSVPQLYSLMITGWLIENFHNYQVILPVAGVTVLMAFGATYRMQPLIPASKQQLL